MKNQTIRHACGCRLEHQVYGSEDFWAAKAKSLESQICWQCRKIARAEAGRTSEQTRRIRELGEDVGLAADLAMRAAELN